MKDYKILDVKVKKKKKKKLNSNLKNYEILKNGVFVRIECN